MTAFAAVTVPAHADSFYVNDFADVLSPATEQYIMERSRAYDNSDGFSGGGGGFGGGGASGKF